MLSSVSIDISSVPTRRCLFRCRFLSETEQVDDHVKLGHTAHVRAICRDTGNRDDKNCASGPSNYIAEKTIGAIYRTRHKIAKATAATSTIWHHEFKAKVGSAAGCRLLSPSFCGAMQLAAPSKQRSHDWGTWVFGFYRWHLPTGFET